MSADLYSFKSRNRCPEKDTVSDIRISAHSLSGRLIAAVRGLAGRQGQRQPSASHGRKLPSLIDHTRERIGKHAAQNAVDHHRAHGHLARVGFSARLTVDQIRQQVFIPLFEGDIRDASPGPVQRFSGLALFFLQKLLEVFQIFLFFLLLPLQLQRLSFRVVDQIPVGGKVRLRLLDQIRQPLRFLLGMPVKGLQLGFLLLQGLELF